MASTSVPNGLPQLECDLVMKGGVTSGVVYPAAVAAIARDYRIRSVGGTSAGAIGAAGAAAMEFGRQSGRNPDARVQLETLAEQLGAREGGVSLLGRLFQPDPGLAALVGRLFGLGAGMPQVGRRLLWSLAGLPLAVAVAAAAAAAVLAVALLPTGTPAGVQAGLAALLFLTTLVATAAVLLLVRGAFFVDEAARTVARSGFGICSGMTRWQTRTAQAPALGEWVHEQIQSLAGLGPDEPLCFGDLWLASRRRPGDDREACFATRGAAGEEPRRDIELALVASDFSRAQSVQLPFLRDPRRYFFRRDDLAALLPAAIVDWMVDHARDSDLSAVETHDAPRDQLFRLPAPEDLPILFAVRMSMSVPFLFRAVRLYLLRRVADREELVEIWLGDGGLTSNFPLHLFDSPVPGRPTFCLNLLYPGDVFEREPKRRPATMGSDPDEEEHPATPEALAAEGEEEVPAPSPDGEGRVYMLRTNWGRLEPYTPLPAEGRLHGLTRYANRLFDTARNWSDNQLIDVPGYRDRIVHIEMGPNEGGFTFDMDIEVIKRLQDRGAFAGRVIAGRFLPGATEDPLYPGEKLVLNWSNHRMARLRSWLAGFEIAVSRFAAGWQTDVDGGMPAKRGGAPVTPTVADMVQGRQSGADGVPFQYYGYPFRSTEQIRVAEKMIGATCRIGEPYGGTVEVGVDYVKGEPSSPRPKSLLRLRPLGDADARTLRP